MNNCGRFLEVFILKGLQVNIIRGRRSRFRCLLATRWRAFRA